MPTGSIRLKIVELQRPQTVYFIEAKWHHTIKDVKDMLRKVTHTPARLFLFLPNSPSQLRNSITLHDLGLDSDANSVHTLRFATSDPSSSTDVHLAAISDVEIGSLSEQLVDHVRNGLDSNKAPGKTELFDCTGGVYFMKNTRGAKTAVFKPSDEEQGMPNNTKGYVDSALRSHFTPGQGYMREFGAFLLDVENRSQVPATALVQCKHRVFNYPSGFSSNSKPKIGSLQQFIVSSEDLFEDFGYGVFSDYEVQKIALFDMRVLNCDRNSANILVVRKQVTNRSRNGSTVSEDNGLSNFVPDDERDFLSIDDDVDSNHEVLELIPIDHGYCIPSKLEIHDYDWAWFGYPQVDKPAVPELKDYLASINIDELVAEVSNRVSLPEECWFLVRTVHSLLVEGLIKANLTIKQVASLIARLDDEIPSPLERIISEASENATRTIASRYDRKTARAAKAQFEARKRIWAMSAGLSGGALAKLQSLSPSLEHHRSKDSLSSLSAKDSVSSFAISELDSLQGYNPGRGPIRGSSDASEFSVGSGRVDLKAGQNNSSESISVKGSHDDESDDAYVMGVSLDDRSISSSTSTSPSPSSPHRLCRSGVSSPAALPGAYVALTSSQSCYNTPPLTSPISPLFSSHSHSGCSPPKLGLGCGPMTSGSSPMWKNSQQCPTVLEVEEDVVSGDEEERVDDNDKDYLKRRERWSKQSFYPDSDGFADGKPRFSTQFDSSENGNGVNAIDNSTSGPTTISYSQYSSMVSSLAGQGLTRMATLHSFSDPIDSSNNNSVNMTISSQEYPFPVDYSSSSLNYVSRAAASSVSFVAPNDSSGSKTVSFGNTSSNSKLSFSVGFGQSQADSFTSFGPIPIPSSSNAVLSGQQEQQQHFPPSAVYRDIDVDSTLTSYSTDAPSYSSVVGLDLYSGSTLAEVENEYGIGIASDDGYSYNSHCDNNDLFPSLLNPDDLVDEVGPTNVFNTDVTETEKDDNDDDRNDDALLDGMTWASPELITSALAATKALAAPTESSTSASISTQLYSFARTNIESKSHDLSNISDNATVTDIPMLQSKPFEVSPNVSLGSTDSGRSKLTFSSPIRLARVTSFGGFGSENKFEISSEEQSQQKQMQRMQWNNFKQLKSGTGHESEMWQVKYEFDALMTIFAKQAILNIISRTLRTSSL